MKIAVIVCDASGYAHAGLDVTRTVKIFDLPKDVADYIAGYSANQYSTITLALTDEEPTP